MKLEIERTFGPLNHTAYQHKTCLTGLLADQPKIMRGGGKNTSVL